ncbi:MAG: class C sortase [Lachnospiraceae bacterium]|jgi:sortase A
MRRKKKRKKRTKGEVVRSAVFLMGFILSVYPVMSSLMYKQYQKNMAAVHKNGAAALAEADKGRMKREAQAYNAALYQSQRPLLKGKGQELLSGDHYTQLLNMNGDGIMGSVEIPKIDVLLPVYHGTEEEVLLVAAGHVEGTSLPIGGVNTRAVITAHRGLPNAKLFTRLDELEAGDYFFLRVLDVILAYKVTGVQVIAPKETENIRIVPGRDLVSLVTCTPYGRNTHRLVVTGERVECEETGYDRIKEGMLSFREMIFLCVPFVFLGIRFVTMRKRKEADTDEKEIF